MKGVNYITDDRNKVKAVVIDIRALKRFENDKEDLFDIIIAESRRNEPSVPWEEVKKKLKKKGKL